jgi:uncharacterized protein
MPAFLGFILLFTLSAYGLDVPVPALTSPVMDEAKLFTESEQQDLANLAYEINTNKGPQITVLTVNDLQGFAIEDYSMSVAEKWQLGTKENGNGLLLLIAKNDHKVRIEVGNGIEGEITDYDTAQFTRDIFPQYFRRGEYYAATRIFMEDMAKKFNIKTNGQSPVLRRAPARNQGFGVGLIALLFLSSSFLSSSI